MIVIGLGCGRSGTASLASLIGSQDQAICFHELNPACAVFEGNPRPVLNTIEEFNRIIEGGDQRFLTVDYSREVSVRKYQELQAMVRPALMGDVAYYYLSYVGDILALNDTVRFVCIKRDKAETIESWMRKSHIIRWPSLWLADRLKAAITRTRFHESYNFWQEHDGSFWALDPVWDSTFPKFEAGSKREAIEKYWDYYYEEADRLAREYPENFRIFDIGHLSNQDGQSEILSFVGVKEKDVVLKKVFHQHKSE